MSSYLRIGYFTAQPSSLDPFHGFDPDSYTAITACHDSLTNINGSGQLVPGLALSWSRIDPLCMEFKLREGVEFHNGEKFNALAAERTLRAQRDPANKSPTGQGILSPIKDIEIVDDYTIRLHTEFPDAMLLWRLAMFSDIVPPRLLEEYGVHHFKDHPIGTGPFIFESMEKGKDICYRANPNYWGKKPQIEGFRFVIMPAPYWVEALVDNKLDLVYGLHGVQAPLLENRDEITMKSRLAALSHWFLLASHGPLADKNVRLALNLAIDNHMIAKVQGQDTSIPQRCVGTEGQFGASVDVMVHPFNQEKARELMRQAGYADGFTLKGLVADHSASLVQMISAYLADINVTLDYEVVPRTVWMDRVPNARMSGQGQYAGDFAVAPVDNPIMYSGFHHYIFLFSQGPFALLNNPEYDQRFLGAMTTTEGAEKNLQDLDRFVHDEALLLLTVQSSVLVAARAGVEIDISINGHFDNFSWLSLRDGRSTEVRPEWAYDYLDFETPIEPGEFKKVFEGTQYSSDMFYFPPQHLADRRLQKMVANLNYQQQVKILQDKIRFYQIVQFLNKNRDMEGILDASRFSGIANYNLSGKLILCNPAYVELFGEDVKKQNLRAIFTSDTEWDKFTRMLASEGGLFGSMNFLRTDRTLLEAQAACSLRKGSAGETIGYLLILRDESEERQLKKELERSYQDLEEKVIQRTAELKKTLDEVQQLKYVQDGDYFLTTLLLDPLGINRVDSEDICVEFFSKEKKQFSFKGKDYEIGGDISIAHSVRLRDRAYTLVLNADAMGKSIQGAGGVLVLGSLVRAIIERTRISPVEKNYYPERWLKNAVNEVQLVFESFNGSMLVSLVMGLIDDESGFFYFVNAEHPAPVLYRDGKGSFLDTTFSLRKIGTPGTKLDIRIKTFRMRSGDVIFLGSDGKDDILMQRAEGARFVNEDESLFLRHVENAGGELARIVKNIEQTGEIMDDLSIVRIAYNRTRTVHSTGDFEPVDRSALEQALRQEPGSRVLMKRLLREYLAAGDTLKAAQLMERLAESAPGDTDTIYRASLLYKKSRSISNAIDLGERIRLREGVHTRNLLTLADSYAYSGNAPRSLRILEEFEALEPGNPRGRLLREAIERKFGDTPAVFA